VFWHVRSHHVRRERDPCWHTLACVKSCMRLALDESFCDNFIIVKLKELQFALVEGLRQDLCIH